MLTPGKAIRKTCVDCAGGAREVVGCQGDKSVAGPCPFYPYRTGKGRPSVKLIRKFCLHCMNGHANLVNECQSKTCFLVSYRM